MGSTAEDLISEDLALEVVGVSGNTLQRFAEAGYLKTQKDPTGRQQYFKSELAKIFGIKDFKLYDFEAARQQKEAQTLGESVTKEIQPESSLFSDNLIATSTEINQEQETAVTMQNSTSSGFAPFELVYGEQTSQAQEAIVLGNEVFHGSTSELNNPEQTFREQAEIASASLQMQIEKLKVDVYKLTAVSELQDKLLEARESEIKDLKEQREWLQQRVERMEEKANRDQVLLLTETQILTKMISLRENKKGAIQKAIEWLGLASDNTNN